MNRVSRKSCWSQLHHTGKKTVSCFLRYRGQIKYRLPSANPQRVKAWWLSNLLQNVNLAFRIAIDRSILITYEKNSRRVARRSGDPGSNPGPGENFSLVINCCKIFSKHHSINSSAILCFIIEVLNWNPRVEGMITSSNSAALQLL